MTKKLLSKTSWYKQKSDKEKPALKRTREAKTISKRNDNNEKPPSAVLFVPRTPGGELAIRLREAEQQLQKVGKTRVKIVE